MSQKFRFPTLSITGVMVLLFCFGSVGIQADDLYFPTGSDTWKVIAPDEAGWDSKKLQLALDYADKHQSSGVVVLYRGRIMAEQYWQPSAAKVKPNGQANKYGFRMLGKDASGHSIEDVASAQKSISAMLVGIALDKGLLKLDDPVDKYLGAGWSQATAAQEKAIQVRHLITMTTGLTDKLTFAKKPGSAWRYNTTAYSKTMDVVSEAAKKDRNELTREWLTGPIGMADSRWAKRPSRSGSSSGNAYGFATTARDLARFGLMVINNGDWNGKPVVNDKAYLKEALTSSQPLNPYYGYLWWLNDPTKANLDVKKKRKK